LNDKDYIKIFEDTEALMYGHFVLSSGMHSDAYFQCAKVLQYPKYLSLFADMLSSHFADLSIDKVISPAIGGIVLGTEVGRQLNKRTIFSERVDGEMQLRRGFEIKPGEKILIIEIFRKLSDINFFNTAYNKNCMGITYRYSIKIVFSIFIFKYFIFLMIQFSL